MEPIPETGDVAELRAHLWRAVREKNNVPAMRLLLEELRREHEDTGEVQGIIDELAAKRAATAT